MLHSAQINTRMGFVDMSTESEANQSSGADATIQVHANIEGSPHDVKATDAWFESSGETTPKYLVTLQNSAASDVTAYEVKWTLYNSKGEQVSFSSTVESALPVPLIKAGEEFTTPGGGSCIYFKGFHTERATAEVTYYQLVDGTTYDSKKTQYGANLQARRVEWGGFYKQIESAIANKSPKEAEAEMKRQIEAELLRNPKSSPAQELRTALNSQGIAKTTALMSKAIEFAQK